MRLRHHVPVLGARQHLGKVLRSRGRVVRIVAGYDERWQVEQREALGRRTGSGVSVEELIQSSLEEKLARDAEFDRAARHVLAKNAELYGRLS